MTEITNSRFVCDNCKTQKDIIDRDRIFAEGWNIVDDINIKVGKKSSHRLENEQDFHFANVDSSKHFCSNNCMYMYIKNLVEGTSEQYRRVKPIQPIKQPQREEISDEDNNYALPTNARPNVDYNPDQQPPTDQEIESFKPY